MTGIFSSIIGSDMTFSTFLVCLATALVLGFVIAFSYRYKNTYSKSLVITLAILPAAVEMVMMLVNGQIGTGIAVAGAFSLFRFRSAPGTAREISNILISMTVGIACGMGYIAIATVFTIVMLGVMILYQALNFGENKRVNRQLKVVIPENLDYTGLFDDIFSKYTSNAELEKVRTQNMGTVFQLTYNIEIKDPLNEKKMIDEIRCRNGNLDVICGKIPETSEVL